MHSHIYRRILITSHGRINILSIIITSQYYNSISTFKVGASRMLVEAACTVLIRGTINECTLRNTFGHPEVYIGRQLCVIFCLGEHPYASLLVDSPDKAESLPTWPVYMVLFIAILFFLVGSTSPLNSFF
jgi:hypothetical protein